MCDLVNTLGKKLIRKEREAVVDVDTKTLVGEGLLVGLYFSACWCPPCKTFTPELAEWFSTLTSTGNKLNGKLEIVFISSDENETEFNNYFKQMPWYALPYSDRERKKSISEQFDISGIPTLIFVDSKTGKIHSKAGRQIVTEDKNGTDFPWLPATTPPTGLITNLLTDSIQDNKGNTFKPESVIGNKIVSLFFSAHWCPPCKRFTPLLLNLYDHVNKDEKKWEIIFFSLDRNIDEYNQYFVTLPFKGLSFNIKKAKKMARRFFISGIPALVMMNAGMEVLNLNARTHVEIDTKAEFFPWKAGIFGEMKSTHDAAYAIAHPSVIYATSTSKEEIAKAETILKEVYDSFKGRKDILMNFFYYVRNPNTLATDPCEEIYQKAIDKVGVCILFDAKNSSKYVFEKIDKTEMRDRIQQFLSDELKMESLS